MRTSQQTTTAANALEGPLTAVTGTQRANINGRTMAIDSSSATVYVLTASGLQIVPFDTTGTQNIPQAPANGVVNTANYMPNRGLGRVGLHLRAAPGFRRLRRQHPAAHRSGRHLRDPQQRAVAAAGRFPNQINAQLPPTLAAGRYPLVVRSIANHEASSSATVAVARYAPAVFVDADGPAIFHQDGTRLDRYHPGHRDEPLTIYATGLGPTTGGKVTAGVPGSFEPAGGDRPGAGVLWRSHHLRRAGNCGLERARSRVDRRLPDQLPHTRHALERRRAARDPANRRRQQPCHGSNRPPYTSSRARGQTPGGARPRVPRRGPLGRALPARTPVSVPEFRKLTPPTPGTHSPPPNIPVDTGTAIMSPRMLFHYLGHGIWRESVRESV
jgi:hypothetical protein